MQVVLTPYMAPNANAFADRFVLSIKSECLERMKFLGHRSPTSSALHENRTSATSPCAGGAHPSRTRIRTEIKTFGNRYLQVVGSE